jgi:hypothetical protein
MLSSADARAIPAEIQELTNEDSQDPLPSMDSNEEILYLLFEHLKQQ